MTETSTWTPGWISPPGDTILDALEERGWTQAELAERTGFSRRHVNALVQGRATLSAETAFRLASVIGSSIDFWLVREAQYRAALERRRRQELLDSEDHVRWLATLPIDWMSARGWVRRHESTGDQVSECLRFFGVSSLDQWKVRFLDPMVMAFDRPREAVTAETVAGASAWYCQAEREAALVRTEAFDRNRLREAVAEDRQFRVVAPDRRSAASRVQSQLAELGVAFVVVPAPPACPIRVAAFRLPAGQPVVAVEEDWFRPSTVSRLVLLGFDFLLRLEGRRLLAEVAQPETLPVTPVERSRPSWRVAHEEEEHRGVVPLGRRRDE